MGLAQVTGVCCWARLKSGLTGLYSSGRMGPPAVGTGMQGGNVQEMTSQLVSNLIQSIASGGAINQEAQQQQRASSRSGTSTSPTTNTASLSSASGAGRAFNTNNFECLFEPFYVDREPLGLNGQNMLNSRLRRVEEGLDRNEQLLRGEGSAIRANTSSAQTRDEAHGSSTTDDDAGMASNGMSTGVPQPPAATEVTHEANVRHVGEALMRFSQHHMHVVAEMGRVGELLTRASSLSHSERIVLQRDVENLAELFQHIGNSYRNLTPAVVGTRVARSGEQSTETMGQNQICTERERGPSSDGESAVVDPDANQGVEVGVHSVAQVTRQFSLQTQVPAGASLPEGGQMAAVAGEQQQQLFNLGEGVIPGVSQVQVEIHSVPVRVSSDENGNFQVGQNPLLQTLLGGLAGQPSSDQQQQQQQQQQQSSTQSEQSGATGDNANASAAGAAPALFGQLFGFLQGLQQQGGTSQQQDNQNPSQAAGDSEPANGISPQNVVGGIIQNLFGQYANLPNPDADRSGNNRTSSRSSTGIPTAAAGSEGGEGGPKKCGPR